MVRLVVSSHTDCIQLDGFERALDSGTCQLQWDNVVSLTCRSSVVAVGSKMRTGRLLRMARLAGVSGLPARREQGAVHSEDTGPSL